MHTQWISQDIDATSQQARSIQFVIQFVVKFWSDSPDNLFDYSQRDSRCHGHGHGHGNFILMICFDRCSRRESCFIQCAILSSPISFWKRKSKRLSGGFVHTKHMSQCSGGGPVACTDFGLHTLRQHPRLWVDCTHADYTETVAMLWEQDPTHIHYARDSVMNNLSTHEISLFDAEFILSNESFLFIRRRCVGLRWGGQHHFNSPLQLKKLWV